MNFISFAPIAWILVSCASAGRTEHLHPPSYSMAEDRSSKIVIHKRTANFIDLEAPVDQVWIGCDQTDQLGENSFMAILVRDDDMIYDFFARRPYSVEICLKKEREYRHIAQGAKSVRIVGVHPITIAEPTSDRGLSKRIPRRFQVAPNIQQQVFIRIQAQDQCGSYFADDCDLPKNYWAGTDPG